MRKDARRENNGLRAVNGTRIPCVGAGAERGQLGHHGAGASHPVVADARGFGGQAAGWAGSNR